MRKVRWAVRHARCRADRDGASPSTTASSISSMEMAPSSGLSDAAGTGPSYGRPSRARPGSGASWLGGLEARPGTGADNAVLLDFQPDGDRPVRLAWADIRIASLEPDASGFSVRSRPAG